MADTFLPAWLSKIYHTHKIQLPTTGLCLQKRQVALFLIHLLRIFQKYLSLLRKRPITDHASRLNA